MYSIIINAVDNSEKSYNGVCIGVELGKKFNSRLIGLHVTNPGLHDDSFRKMENGLPEEYQDEEILEHQREVHDDLITEGLRLISESYLDQFEKSTTSAGLKHESAVIYGKNFEELSKRINNEPSDLAIFGDHGLGKSPETILGSVTERTMRRVRSDYLIAKNPELLENDKIIIAFDGSEPSYRALKRAFIIAESFDAKVEVVHVFDPYFHRVIFQKLVSVLSEEAADMFNFEDQQELHDNVIDKGLKKVGVKNLKMAEMVAKDRGIEINTKILDGKEFQEILDRTKEIDADLLVVGRYGKHISKTMDIGSTSENLARLAPCNVLIVNKDIDGDFPVLDELMEALTTDHIEWTVDAEEFLSKAPKFVQGMARQMVNSWAKEEGLNKITVEDLKNAASERMPSRMADNMFPSD